VGGSKGPPPTLKSLPPNEVHRADILTDMLIASLGLQVQAVLFQLWFLSFYFS